MDKTTKVIFSIAIIAISVLLFLVNSARATELSKECVYNSTIKQFECNRIQIKPEYNCHLTVHKRHTAIECKR